MKAYRLVFSAVALLLAGCSSTVYKKFSIDDYPPTSLSVDVKQRVVLNTNRGGGKDKDGKERNLHIVCAEPSPDAMTIRAASGAAGADIKPPAAVGEAAGSYGINLGGSSAEGAAFIGMRTQTIQLLRDGLYRACEAYFNGAIDTGTYHSIVSGYDEFVITLTAISGLTETKSVPPIAINSASSFNNGSLPGGNNGAPGSTPSGNTNTTVNLSAEQPDTSNKVDKDVADKVKEIIKLYLEHKEKLRTIAAEARAIAR